MFLNKKIITFLALITISISVIAQSYNKTSNFKSQWQINASAGSSLFFGDVKQYKIWPVTSNENEWRFAGALQLGKQISSVFGIRAQAIYGKLAGTRRAWNMFFESNYYEFNANTTVSIRNIISKYKNNQLWDTYMILGIGIVNYNTEVKDLTTKAVIKKIGYGNGKSFGGRTLQGIFTGGLGFSLRLSNNWNINIESVNKIMNSDDMDGYENSFIYDVYNYTSLGITYKFGKKKQNKSKETYSYFEENENKRSNDAVKQAEYDDYGTEPVSPPSETLVIEPSIVVTPVYEDFTKEEEIIVEETPIAPTQVIREVVVIGVEYRVQIAAKYGRKLPIHYLNNYNVPFEQIKENTYNGYYIYTVGSFSNYRQAREKRNALRNNGISDAFVVAFINGERLNKLPQ